MKRASLAAPTLALALAACGGGTAEPDPRPSIRYEAVAVAPGAECPAGGVRVDMGIDENENGLLDASEIDASEVVCNGDAALVKVTQEPKGTHCSGGGILVQSGVDDDGDGVLDVPGEVDASEYVCNAPAPAAPAILSLTLVSGSASLSGTLGAGDLLLADGSRADLYRFTAAAAGSVVVSRLASGVEAYLFTAACATEPEIAKWGPCYVAEAGSDPWLAAGDHVLLVKGAQGVNAWETVAYSGTVRVYAGVRFPTGAVDPAFSGDGVATLSTSGATYVQPLAVALDASGRVLLSFYAYDGASGSHTLARFTAAGALDTAFAGDGTVATAGWVGALSADGSGRVVGAGETGGTSGKLAVYRFLSTGAADTAFSSDGVASIATASLSYASALALDGTRIVVAGGVDVVGTGWTVGVARFLADGTADTAFSGDGLATWTPPSGWSGDGDAVAVQADGKVLVAAELSSSSGSSTVLLRFLANGTLDTSFGTSGVATLPLDRVSTVEVRTEGLLVTGALEEAAATLYRPAAARLTASGALDSTYGTDGVLEAGATFGSVCAAAVDVAGRLVVVSGTASGTTFETHFSRWLADGSADAWFGGDGALVSSAGACDVAAFSGDRVVAAFSSSTDTVGVLLVK